MLTSGAYGYLSDYLLLWALLVSLLFHAWFFFKLFPRDRFKKTGLVLGNALIFLCMLGVAGMVMETHIRFTVVETDSFGASLPARRWFALHTRLNSLGFRDEEWAVPKPPGVWRIAFVGDSFTYGWGIREESDRFTELIQKRFDERFPGTVEVLNVAKPGWNTGDEGPAILEIIDQLGVDEVVLCYVPNDIEGLIPKTKGSDPTRPPDSVFFNLDTSCLVDYLYRRIYLPRLPTVRGFHDWLASGYGDDAIWRDHQHQLHSIAVLCDQRGVKLLVALFPFIRTTGERLQIDRLNGLLGRFLATNQVGHVDLAPAIAGRPAQELVVNAADAHPNELAHRLFADALWQALGGDRSRRD